MRIGVPKEIKAREPRVGLVPAAVKELGRAGHEVRVETSAGAEIGFSDDDYCAAGACAAGAESVCDVASAFDAELIVEVKEPQLHECAMLQRSQVLLTYLHLAADPTQAAALCTSGATAMAYETVTAEYGSLPLLTPMNEVAGRMSVQVGAACLEKARDGGLIPSHPCLT